METSAPVSLYTVRLDEAVDTHRCSVRLMI